MKHAESTEILSTQATVRSSESGADGLIKPEAVLHWLQETAETHAALLGFGYDFVISRGLAWVEVSLDMAVIRRPAWKEAVELRTWTAQASPVLARRNTEIRDAEGNCIITASCLWAVIDIRRRRPVPLGKYMERFPDTPCEEMASPLTMETSGLQPAIREWTAERRDTDFNRHINNAAYLVWAMESLPETWLEEHDLTGIHLRFRKESHAGEQLASHLFLQENLSSHQILQGEELRAEIILEWKPSTSHS